MQFFRMPGSVDGTPGLNPRVYTHAAWIAPLILWAVLYGSRPWKLGLFHDDWIMNRAFSWTETTDLFWQFPGRPLMVAFHVVLGSMLGSNPVLWQLAMALMSLVSAGAIGMVAFRLAQTLNASACMARAAGALGAAAWLSFPWSLGFTVWVVTANGFPSLLLFCGFILVVLSHFGQRRKLAAITLLILLNGLVSELYFGMGLLIATYGAYVAVRRDRSKLAEQAVLIGWVAILYFILSVYNRSWAWLGIGQNKPVSLTAVQIFRDSLLESPAALASSLYGAQWVTALVGLVSVIALLGAYRSKRLMPFLLLAAVIAMGCVFSAALFAIGGYKIQALGIQSRSTIVISFWLALIPAVLLPMLSTFGRNATRFAAIGGTLVILVMAGAQMQAIQTWELAWTFQKQLLQNFPIVDYERLAKPGSLVVVDAERPIGASEGFEAFWDISPALSVSFPAVAALQGQPVRAGPIIGAVAVMLNREKFATRWDGSVLAQSWCRTPDILWSLKAPRPLLIWHADTKHLEALNEPISLGC